MKNKSMIMMLIGFTFLSFTKSNPPTNNLTIKTKNKTDGAMNYQKNFKQFAYYIETIGTVSIDNVELNNKKLTAIYSYQQGGEHRNVVSELDQDNDGIYKGTCTTKVNGKVLLAVNTWLTFNDDGTAVGNWSWSGAPSKNDPIVTISKK
jgi:hypothetical protein